MVQFKFNPISKKLDIVETSSSPTGDVSFLTGNTGGAVPPDSNHNINTVGAGSIEIVGNPGTNTTTTQLTGLTNHNVLLGAGTTTITKVAPHATVGTPFCSAGAGADPAFDTTPVVTSVTISDMPASPTDGTNKAYVDLLAAGMSFKNTCYVSTTANLNATYNNGASGVGATLTNAGALAAFSSDGVSPPLNSRVLVKNQSSQLQNGIYTLTTIGSGAVAWVLTRATDYDADAEINQGNIVPVELGTLYANTTWLQTQNVVTIGVDSIIFIQFQSSPITTTQYASLVGGANNTISSVGPSPTAGQIYQSGGSSANPAFSTATYPSTASSTGTILRSDGTNWSATTATYPNTTTANQIIYSSATNTVGGLSSANNGVLVTSNTGVPSILAGPGTTGNILQSNASAAPSYSTATYPSTAGSSGNVITSNGTNFVSTSPSAVGSWVFLQSQTASASASIAFNSSVITATYSNYIVVFYNLVKSNSGSLLLTYSTNNGSSYVATGYTGAINSSAYTSATLANTNSTTNIPLGSTYTEATLPGSGVLYFFNMTNGGVPTMRGDVIGNTSSATTFGYVCGHVQTPNINNIKFEPSAGTLTTGTFVLYGLRVS